VLGTVVVVAMIAALLAPKAVHAIVATAVQVVNTPDVRDADNPAKHPFVSRCGMALSSEGNFCNFDTVPAGFRLVIEVFTPIIDMSPGDRPVSVQLGGSANGTIYQLFYPVSLSGTEPGSLDMWGVSQPLTRAYADPGSTPSCFVGALLGQGVSATCVISGYLVSVP
jgi:hypothetical protein